MCVSATLLSGCSAVGADACFVAPAVVSANGIEPLECACGATAVGGAAGVMAALPLAIARKT